MGRYIASEIGLTDADVRSRSPGYARVLQSLAGRIRTLYELATGRSVDANEQPCTSRNPQGLLGVDFSGPPWGSAWRHPLLTAGGLKPDTSGAGAWEGHHTYGSVVDGVRLIIPIRVWVRPFEPTELAPYSRGYPALSLYQASASAPFTVIVRCRSRPGSNVGSRNSAVSVDSEDETLFTPNVYWELRPGWNDLELELETTSTVEAVLASWAINNIEKRGH